MYFRSQGSVRLLFVGLAACVACHAQHALADDPSIELTQQDEWEVRIEAALNAEGEWEFKDLPLNEVCAFIHEKLQIDVAIDTKSLEDYGIDPATPITRSLSGVSNRSFLRLMLRDLELTYIIRSGELWITTPEYAESQLHTKVYPVGDLLVRDNTLDNRVGDNQLLIEAITTSIAPDSWDVVGGAGSIGGIYDALVVSQTSPVHDEVDQLLTSYRRVIAGDGEGGRSERAVFMLGAGADVSLRAALDKPLTAQFGDVPLREALDFISRVINIPIVIHTKALENFAIDASTPIEQRFTKTRLRFALERMLSELELTYILRDEVLLITTPEEAEAQLLVGLYPVRDLVELGAETAIGPLGERFDFDSLIAMIDATVAPDTWDAVGGPGSIVSLLPVPTLAISQTLDLHDEISELLKKLRAAKRLSEARSAAEESVDPQAMLLRSYPLYPAYYAPDEVVKLVIRASDPGTWDAEAGTFVQGLGASIVVKHNVHGHRQVQKLLSSLGVWSPMRHATHSGEQGLGGGLAAPGSGAQPAVPGGGGGVF